VDRKNIRKIRKFKRW